MRLIQILKYVYKLRKVSFMQTLWFNFRSLPLKQAKHLPILLYHAEVVQIGRVHILGQVEFGMIRLGINMSSQCFRRPGIKIINRGMMEFEGPCFIGSNSVVETGKNGILHVGKNATVTGGCHICARKEISIGENLSCSWDTSIFDTDFHVTVSFDDDLSVPVDMRYKNEPQAVHIGSNVWICQGSLIQKGTIIPDWTIVAARSLVRGCYNEYGAYNIIGGMPAKVLKKGVTRLEFLEFRHSPITSIIKYLGI